jgi:hypothetical protein
VSLNEKKIIIIIEFNRKKGYNLLQMNQVKLIQEVENIIEEYGTLYLALQKAHPVSVTLCPAWLDIIRYYWQNIMIGQGILEHHLLQGMLLVKETIKNSTHTTGKEFIQKKKKKKKKKKKSETIN